MLNVEQTIQIWQVVILVLSALMFWNPLLKSLITLQSAHFNIKQYSKLVLDKLKYEFRSCFFYFFLTIPYIIMIIIENESYQYSLLVFPSLLYVFISFFRADRAKVVYFTNQMKRYSFAYGIVTSILVLSAVRFLPQSYYGLFLAVVFIYSWLAIYLVWLILFPLEKLIESLLLRKVQQLLTDSTITLVVSICNQHSNRYLLDSLLAKKYKGYVNNEPLATFREVLNIVLTKIKPYDEYCLLELDANYYDEITKVLEQLPVKYVVLNVSQIDNIVTNYLNKPEYTVFANSTLVNQCQFDQCEIVSHSLNEEASYQGIKQSYSLSGSKFSILAHGTNYDFETKQLGESKLLELLFVVSIANTLGISITVLQSAIRFLPMDRDYIEIKNYRQRKIVNDRSKNHITEICGVLMSEKNKKVLTTTCLGKDFMYLLENELVFDICIIDTSKLSKRMFSLVDKQELLDRNIYLVSDENEACRKAIELTSNDDIVVFKNEVIGNKCVLV